MARKENKQKKKLSKGWKIALIVLGAVLGVALVAGIPALIGLLTLARDLLFTLPVLALGGVAGVTIADKIKTNRAKKKEAEANKNLTRSQNLEQLPLLEAARTEQKDEVKSNVVDQEKNLTQDNSKISKR